MFRIDSDGATGDNQFTEGNPAEGVPATRVTGDWLNAIQAEVSNVIESAGIALDKEKNNQLSSAIRKIIESYFTGLNQRKEFNGFQKLPGGVVLQWMGSQTRTSGDKIKWPVSFPTAIVFGSAVHFSPGATAPTYYSIKYTGLDSGEILLPPNTNSITTAVFLVGW